MREIRTYGSGREGTGNQPLTFIRRPPRQVLQCLTVGDVIFGIAFTTHKCHGLIYGKPRERGSNIKNVEGS